MTDLIVTPNLQNCSTVNFPFKIRSRRLSAIVKKVRQGDASEYDKATGIGYAAKEGHLDVIKYLVNEGASHKAGNALVAAARKGHLNIIEFLLERNDCAHYETEAFIEAIVNGHLAIVKHFVDRRIVDVSAYESALVATACAQGHWEVAQYLVEEGADLHKNHELALRYAAEGGHFHAVKYLLEQGADIHAQDEQALCKALKYGHFLLAIYLLQQGANPYHENVRDILNTVHLKHPEFHFLCQSFCYLKNEIAA